MTTDYIKAATSYGYKAGKASLHGDWAMVNHHQRALRGLQLIADDSAALQKAFDMAYREGAYSDLGGASK